MFASYQGRRFVTSVAFVCLAATVFTGGERIADEPRRSFFGSPSDLPTMPQAYAAPAHEFSFALAEAGREQFTRLRHAAPSPDSKGNPKLTSHRLFNARSCAECHRLGGVGGAGPNENDVLLLSELALRREANTLRRLGAGPQNSVFPRLSLSPEYAAWRTAALKDLEPRPPLIPAALKLRIGTMDTLSVPTKPAGLPDRDLVSRRNTPPLFGLGLLESIPQSAIDAVAMAQHEDIRGRSPRLPGGGFGRFGWKSSTATLAAFNERACAVELGLTTPGFAPAVFPSSLVVSPLAEAASTVPRPAPVLRAAAPSTPDMSAADLDALTAYVASLPAPRQVIPPAKHDQVAAGERHFRKIGCADCHTPDLGGVRGVYSDLLLHSVGTSGDSFYGNSRRRGSEGADFDVVEPGEFRTPPLWGVADSGPYLHDGSAATLEEAILAHDNEAGDAAFAYERGLTYIEQQALVAFLESLRAPQ
jgi:CxxC motif-containing protein (DUF1111 family)